MKTTVRYSEERAPVMGGSETCISAAVGQRHVSPWAVRVVCALVQAVTKRSSCLLLLRGTLSHGTTPVSVVGVVSLENGMEAGWCLSICKQIAVIFEGVLNYPQDMIASVGLSLLETW